LAAIQFFQVLQPGFFLHMAHAPGIHAKIVTGLHFWGYRSTKHKHQEYPVHIHTPAFVLPDIEVHGGIARACPPTPTGTGPYHTLAVHNQMALQPRYEPLPMVLYFPHY